MVGETPGSLAQVVAAPNLLVAMVYFFTTVYLELEKESFLLRNVLESGRNLNY